MLLSFVVQSETDRESIGHIICQKAEDLKVTVVVMASHKRSGLAEWLMGSCSQ